MKKLLLCLALFGLCFFSANIVFAEGTEVIADFEEDEDGWGIPDWAYEKDDHVATEIAVSDKVASLGKKSLKIEADFPGKMWSAAIVEIEEYYDFSDYDRIAVDIYVPKDCPKGLKGKIIVTYGEEWKWCEQSRSYKLAPGEWTTITASMADGSKDWKRTKVDADFRSDIRKVDIRIESNMKPVYKGPVYIDNVKVSKGQVEPEKK